VEELGDLQVDLEGRWVDAMSTIDGHGPLRDLWNHRALLGRMVKRDIRSRYQGSIFGTLWSFATPLLLLCAYWFFQGGAAGRFGSAPQAAFPVFFFPASLPISSSQK
jgi:lipopolysaccharide transport system permease protein